jgi:hypothetical protein
MYKCHLERITHPTGPSKTALNFPSSLSCSWCLFVASQTNNGLSVFSLRLRFQYILREISKKFQSQILIKKVQSNIKTYCSGPSSAAMRDEVEWANDIANQQATVYPVHATNIHPENMPLRWEAGDRQPVLCDVDRICPSWIILPFGNAWQILKEISM